ncbi:uncharacterized protein LOC114526625 [Dendronephthya gigantea]|uniref:uncharacterized protein LOC114526625 n=1 Tax=Dendronephthya gigantea TaxID=151771 RepID=UPI00106C7110|nr:uncharacterized protein LOC114526625 [Dendronephthya gigantea]
MQTLNKTEQIAHLQGKNKSERELALQNMLIAYRDTPHPATGVSPYEAMTGRPIRTRLNHADAQESDRHEKDRAIDKRDKEYKTRMSQQKRNTKKHNFTVKDYVLLKQKKYNKWSTAFEPAFYTITKIQGSSITIRRIKDGRELCRDASQLKLANLLVEADEEYSKQKDEEQDESIGDRETDEGISDDEAEHDRPAENPDMEPEIAERPRRQKQVPARLRDYILS